MLLLPEDLFKTFSRKVIAVFPAGVRQFQTLRGIVSDTKI